MCRMARLKYRVKNIIQHCKVYLKFKQQSCSQIMGILRTDRCTHIIPGIALAGLFELETSTIRNSTYIKGYASVLEYAFRSVIWSLYSSFPCGIRSLY